MLPYICLLVALGLRFVSMPISFTSVGAALLFFGARGSRQNLWIPVALSAMADVLLTKFAYGYPVTWDHLVTWAWYAGVLGLGLLLRNTNSPVRIGGASLFSSIMFFIVSNFAVWASSYGTMYPRTLAGLGECYTAGIPFFRHNVTLDLVFTAIFFSIPILLRGTAGEQWLPASEEAKAPRH